MQSDGFWAKVGQASRPGRPLFRIKASPWWTNVLVAAGAQRVCASTPVTFPAQRDILADVGGPDPRMVSEVRRLQQRIRDLEAELMQLQEDNDTLAALGGDEDDMLGLAPAEMRTSISEVRKAILQGTETAPQAHVGDRFLGTVVKTTTFGAFLSLRPGVDGLLHVTQIRKLHGRIENVEDVIHVGDKIQVEISEVGRNGRLSLVPVEVLEREAAGEDLSGGDSRRGGGGGGVLPPRDRDRDRGDRGDRRTRHRSRG